MANDLLEKGAALRTHLMGPDYVAAATANEDGLDGWVQTLIMEYGYGAIWTRPEVALQSKCMITIALLATLNRPIELAHHIRGALNAQVTPEQIIEVFAHVILYAGAPAGLGGIRVAREVIAEWRKQSGQGDQVPEA